MLNSLALSNECTILLLCKHYNALNTWKELYYFQDKYSVLKILCFAEYFLKY